MFRPTLIASLAAVAAVASTAPAGAARLLAPDASGDVWVKGSDGVFSEAGSRANTDVVASAVRHTDRRVNASVRYDDLVRDGDRVVTPVRLRASNGTTFLLRVTAEAGDRDGTARVLRYTGKGAQTVQVACEGLQHSVSYADDLVAVSVPRSCLGGPTWVRYGGTVRAVDDEGTVFTDALLSGDPVNDLFSARIARG
jgi:hypothetical protein